MRRGGHPQRAYIKQPGTAAKSRAAEWFVLSTIKVHRATQRVWQNGAAKRTYILSVIRKENTTEYVSMSYTTYTPKATPGTLLLHHGLPKCSRRGNLSQRNREDSMAAHIKIGICATRSQILTAVTWQCVGSEVIHHQIIRTTSTLTKASNNCLFCVTAMWHLISAPSTSTANTCGSYLCWPTIDYL